MVLVRDDVLVSVQPARPLLIRWSGLKNLS